MPLLVDYDFDTAVPPGNNLPKLGASSISIPTNSPNQTRTGGITVAYHYNMEQMQPNGLKVIPIDFDANTIPASVRETHPLVYEDGDAVCCLLGPNPQDGIFGCGETIDAALADFDVHFQELLQHPKEGDPVSEFIRQRHI